MAETQKYKVASPLLHDGTLYQPGEEVSLSEAQAVDLGTVLESPESSPVPSPKAPAVNNPPGVEAEASKPEPEAKPKK